MLAPAATALCRIRRCLQCAFVSVVLIGCSGGGSAQDSGDAPFFGSTSEPQPTDPQPTTPVALPVAKAGDGILLLACDELASVTLKAVDPVQQTTKVIGRYEVTPPLGFAVCLDKGRQVPHKVGVSSDQALFAIQTPGGGGDVGWYEARTGRTTLMRKRVPGATTEFAPPELFAPAFDRNGVFWFAVRSDDRRKVAIYSADAEGNVSDRTTTVKYPPGVLAEMDFFVPGRNGGIAPAGWSHGCTTVEMSDGRQLCPDGFRQFGDPKVSDPIRGKRMPCGSSFDWLVEPTELLCRATIYTVDASGAQVGLRDFLPTSSGIADHLAVDPSKTRAFVELARSAGARDYFIAELSGTSPPLKVTAPLDGMVIAWV